MKQLSVRLQVNQTWIEREVPVEQSLLLFLRETLHLTSVKCGCNAGECGACMVLLDNLPVNSCLVLAAECDGKQIQTLEGLNATPAMQALQKAFLSEGAVQCGFCTPGMLISSYALIYNHPAPTEDEIKLALSGNLCRCTGYQSIVRAVQSAAAQLREVHA